MFNGNSDEDVQEKLSSKSDFEMMLMPFENKRKKVSNKTSGGDLYKLANSLVLTVPSKIDRNLRHTPLTGDAFK